MERDRQIVASLLGRRSSEWCSLTASGSCVVGGGCVDGVSVKWISVARIAGKSLCLSNRKEYWRQVQWQVQTLVDHLGDRERCCNPRLHSRRCSRN